MIPVSDALASPYVERYDEEAGSITLKIKPILYNDVAVENFAGISISAGTDAVNYNNEKDEITITYKADVHLAKAHVFYTGVSEIVPGTNDKTIFDYDEPMFTDAEIDTLYVYTYKNDVAENGEVVHKAGDIVMTAPEGDTPSVACQSIEDLPKGLSPDAVEHTKFYSSAAGLHTDNTVICSADGRAFLLNLDAWYIEGLASQVGLVLDASGSMGFALDTPSPIYVRDIINALREAKKYDEADLLEEKLNAIEENLGIEEAYPHRNSLIGYYKFEGTPFTWRLITSPMQVDEAGPSHTMLAEDVHDTFVDKNGATSKSEDGFFTVRWRNGATHSGTYFTMGSVQNTNDGLIEFKVDESMSPFIVEVVWASQSSAPNGRRIRRASYRYL